MAPLGETLVMTRLALRFTGGAMRGATQCPRQNGHGRNHARSDSDYEPGRVQDRSS